MCENFIAGSLRGLCRFTIEVVEKASEAHLSAGLDLVLVGDVPNRESAAQYLDGVEPG